MKTFTLLLGLSIGAGLCSANIIVTPVPPSCDPSTLDYTGCLRGQHCSAKGVWVTCS